MAGLDILSPKDQKEAENEKEVENENEALDGIENDRLMLKDISCPLAPVLPEKYFQATVQSCVEEISNINGDHVEFKNGEDADKMWEELDHKFEK